ncbi:MAG: hypothetical protein AAGG48_10140 [Planctomycetota bacterium]
MSIDTPPNLSNPESVPQNHLLWDEKTVLIRQSREALAVRDIFGPATKKGGVYCWGVAAAIGQSIDPTWRALSRLSCGLRPGKTDSALDWESPCREFIDHFDIEQAESPLNASLAVLWASALPRLNDHVEPVTWSTLFATLQQLHELFLQRDEQDRVSHLMLAGELGLTLASCLSKMPDCKRMRKPAARAIHQWCRQDVHSVADVLGSHEESRLVVASLIRSWAWIRRLKLDRSEKSIASAGSCLVTWMTALTRPDGTSAFSSASRDDLADDLAPNGLFQHSKVFDEERLTPAIDAALGKTESRRRLAWLVSLPEAMHHEPDAKLATMTCEWDIRPGKTIVDYSSEDMLLEILAGKQAAISGRWQSQIEYDSEQQHPVSSWTDVCQFSDDDVHYLELEQEWTSGITLQRQILMFRDDRCLLLADAVRAPTLNNSTHRVHYASRIPVTDAFTIESEDETRELFLTRKRPKALIIPLAANEWRVGPSDAALRITEDRHLVASVTGLERIYSPLWLDFSPHRFKRKRTWRQLTVADQLRIVNANEAVAYRFQQGSEHWTVYCSLHGKACRTFLGKHLIADFYCSRFDPGDGLHEELVTVDDSSEET